MAGEAGPQCQRQVVGWRYRQQQLIFASPPAVSQTSSSPIATTAIFSARTYSRPPMAGGPGIASRESRPLCSQRSPQGWSGALPMPTEAVRGPAGCAVLQQRAGAKTWTAVRTPFDGSGTGIVPQIVSTDSARVLIAFYGNIAGGVSSHATFFVTANLGRGWTKRVDPCGWTRTNEVDAYDASATPKGTVVVECLAKGVSNQAFVMVSHNGGKTFGPRRPIPPLFANMVAAASANTIVAATGEAGGSGPFTYTLERSTNVGLSWRTVVRDPETLTSSVPGESYLGFVTSSVGHWIGYGNKLWTTTDGGEHWTASNV